eukprot:7224886-Prorocentrum_lima.AAC.1
MGHHGQPLTHLSRLSTSPQQCHHPRLVHFLQKPESRMSKERRYPAFADEPLAHIMLAPMKTKTPATVASMKPVPGDRMSTNK